MKLMSTSKEELVHTIEISGIECLMLSFALTNLIKHVHRGDTTYLLGPDLIDYAKQFRDLARWVEEGELL